MSRLVDRRTRHREAAPARRKSGEFGSLARLRDLKWLKPVHAGETLTFRTTVLDKRASATRPDWGLVLSQGTGHNQAGGGRLQFRAGFVERRGR